MAIVEDVTDQYDGPVATLQQDIAEYKRVLDQLSAKLALPAHLLPSFLNEDKPEEALSQYRLQAWSTLQAIKIQIESPAWSQLSMEEQSKVIFEISRLYDSDGWTSSEIRVIIDEISSYVNKPEIALLILQTHLRQLFSTPHPMINPTSTRALDKPMGGPDAQMDFHDTSSQIWKQSQGWGCHNVLKWCLSELSSEEIQDHIGVVLPPTLTLMDDWEPPWRGRGISVLEVWIDKVDDGRMNRMGMDRLLLDSLIHTSSLQATPPLPHVLPITIRLINRLLEGEKRAKRFEEIMDKAIVQGWMYAKSGEEGRPVLINIAKQLEMLCDIMGTGILRWLKTIIPNLLNPLQYPPTPAVTPHFIANLNALLHVMETLRPTGRIGRWRGMSIDACSRLWVNLDERNLDEDDETEDEKLLRVLVKKVFGMISEDWPESRLTHFRQLIELDEQVFLPLVASVT